MPEILALTPYPYRSADTRYRIAQFGPLLEKAGWRMILSPFMNEALFTIYNQPGRTYEKVTRTLAGLGRRMWDILRASNFDVIWLHKEAFPFGPPLIEGLIKACNPRIIYDMDDAFWTHPPQLNQIGGSFRDHERIAKMIQLSSHVLVGNEFLAAYAGRFNPSVTIFPTVLDLEKYQLRTEIPDDFVTIGWVGRWSSAPYLNNLLPVFERLYAVYPEIKIVMIGTENVSLKGTFPYIVRPWKLEDEVEAIEQFDIGIMPLPDDEYSRGKCGFKLLQYMALGIPAVASPVGVNNTIIRNGINGFTASTADDWFNAISSLVSDFGLRKTIGAAGREYVEKEFNLIDAATHLVQILNELNSMKSFPSIKILDTRIDILTLDDLFDSILTAIQDQQKIIVTNVNIHALNICYKKSEFRAIINNSDIVFCDGIGVKLAAGFLGLPLPYRYTPPDWFSLLCNISSAKGYSTFFLGGRPGVAGKVKEEMSCMKPVNISGTYHGYFAKEKNSDENMRIIRLINQAKPDILAVGFGMPIQEQWIFENIDDLDVKVVISVGAMFDYLARTVIRAPRWMTDNGLEWLARLVIEPRRLWKRYLIGNPLFIWRLFKQRLGLINMNETTGAGQLEK